jgi:hypothetical protein
MLLRKTVLVTNGPGCGSGRANTAYKYPTEENNVSFAKIGTLYMKEKPSKTLFLIRIFCE